MGRSVSKVSSLEIQKERQPRIVKGIRADKDTHSYVSGRMRDQTSNVLPQTSISVQRANATLRVNDGKEGMSDFVRLHHVCLPRGDTGYSEESRQTSV